MGFVVFDALTFKAASFERDSCGWADGAGTGAGGVEAEGKLRRKMEDGRWQASLRAKV